MTDTLRDTAPSRIDLPECPAEMGTQAVAAWSEPVWIDTYEPEAAEEYPSFLGNRVYQGSSGRVFPLPVIERISANKTPRQWQAIHLENEFVRLMIMPELGGRIHIGYNKLDGYDFFYRNNVIKPALVGLAGPWISGGVEFNWPQHHRPATFLPTEWEIENEPDGAITVWNFDNDPMTRMSGAHGIRLRPGSSVIEARVRLYNRSDLPQTFLWWANVAARVNDHYQSFFPEDVHAVADHAKRAVTGFPRATAPYYGIDYPARVDANQPDADRLDFYKNIPVPTSYMVANTKENFFGGYDHEAESGFVHWADRHIAPGKKQWTWGNSEFGWAWDNNLTDGDGPYVELMAGVFTDNQPDFAYLAPGETKTFSQYWFPVTKIGPAHAATLDAALNVEVGPGELGTEETTAVRVRLAPTRDVDHVHVTVSGTDGVCTTRSVGGVEVGAPLDVTFEVPGNVKRSDLKVEVKGTDRTLVSWSGASALTKMPIEAVAEPAMAEEVDSPEELVTIGRYLRQYRHATRDPRSYFVRALELDPHSVEARIHLAEMALDAADLQSAKELAEGVSAQLTSRTPTPRDGYGLYLAGLIAYRLGDFENALDLLGRAQWDAALEAPSGYLMALIYKANGDHGAARATVSKLLAKFPQHQQARRLADTIDGAAIDADRYTVTDPTIMLDDAVELIRMSEPERALARLRLAQDAAATSVNGQVNVLPLIRYYQALLLSEGGMDVQAQDHIDAVEREGIVWSLPTRPEDIDLLRQVTNLWPHHPHAKVLLADWLYEKGRVDAAMELWTQAAEGNLDPRTAARAWRGLGIARYNERRDPLGAATAFDEARALQPDSAKLLFEADQLAERRNQDADQRLDILSNRPELLALRDDLFVSYVSLLTETGNPTEAVTAMSGRHFQPWEGGEGKVLRAWETAQREFAKQLAASGDVSAAIDAIHAALTPPSSLGEAVHPLANRSRLYLALGDLYEQYRNGDDATTWWRKAAESTGDFVHMSDTEFSTESIYAAIADLRLGNRGAAEKFANDFELFIDEIERTPARVDYFATSLPNMLLFNDPIETVRAQEVAQLRQALATVHSEITNTKEQK